MFKSAPVIVYLVYIGLSLHCVNSRVSFQSRNSLDDDVSEYSGIPDVPDNDMETEMQFSEPCARKPKDREYNQIHAQIISTLGCKPREQLISLSSSDPEAELVPSVVSVRRCGGHCLAMKGCQPEAGRITKKKVTVIKVTMRHRQHCESLEDIYVDEHEECMCVQLQDTFIETK